MDHSDQPDATTEEEAASRPTDDHEPFSMVTAADAPAPSLVSPADDPPAARYVYALGRIEPRSPSLAIEKEIAQVAGRAEVAGLTDRQALRALLGERENRYLARQLCWVLAIEGIETYLLYPRTPADTDLLLDSLRPQPRRTDIDVVVGVLGPIAPPEACNNLTIPIVVFDQIYSFDVESLLKSIPRPKGMRAEQFESAAEELFGRIMLLADNAGAADEHRALNYLALRYPAIYHATAERLGANASLTAVDVRPSRLAGARKVVDVVFAYTHRETDVTEKQFVRVDVTEEFPFLVTKLSPYVDHGAW